MKTGDAFLADAKGLQPVGLDKRGGAAGTSRLKVKIAQGDTAANLAPATFSQASVFGVGTVAPLSAAYAKATVTGAITRFNTEALIADYYRTNPAEVRNINITNAPEAVIAEHEVLVTRDEPSGASQSERQYAQEFQSAADNLNTRLQYALSAVVDGFTYLNLLSPLQVADFTYDALFVLGPQTQQRMQVAVGGPAVVVSSAK